MNGTREGSTLIEVLLYFMMSMCIFIGTTQLTMNVYRSSRDHMSRQDDFIQLACALSYLVHDIEEAASEKFLIRVSSKDCLIFRLKEGDCGWFVKKGRLMRYTGTYDPYTQSWSHRSASMIAASAKALSVSYYERAGRLEGVTCRVRGTYHELEQFVATRVYE